MWVLKTEEEGRSVGQREETRQGVDLLLLTMKMEKEGQEPSNAAAPRSWEQPSAHRLQENGDLSYTAVGNWILSTTQMTRKQILPWNLQKEMQPADSFDFIPVKPIPDFRPMEL